MSDPLPPVFDITGGNSGTSAIPLVFDDPGAGFEILWTHDGNEPSTYGVVWSLGQTIPYDSWVYFNANESNASVFVQAIIHDIAEDSYSSIAVQDYIFTCADPLVNQTSTVNVSCTSPNSKIYYYQGGLVDFDTLSSTATEISNPSSISLPDGQYVFFSTTLDGIVYGQNPVQIAVTNGETLNAPTLYAICTGTLLQIIATSTIPEAVFRYTVNGSTPNISSPIMPPSLPVQQDMIVSVIAVSGSDISTPTTTIVKSPGEYAFRGLCLPDREFNLSSSISKLMLAVKSFTVECW